MQAGVIDCAICSWQGHFRLQACRAWLGGDEIESGRRVCRLFRELRSSVQGPGGLGLFNRLVTVDFGLRRPKAAYDRAHS